MENLLNTPALKSFDRYFSDQLPSSPLSRTRSIITHLGNKMRVKGDVTLRHIVTYAYDEDLKKVDKEWLNIRGCGIIGLKTIDKWLESLGLHRGMKL